MINVQEKGNKCAVFLDLKKKKISEKLSMNKEIINWTVPHKNDNAKKCFAIKSNHKGKNK